jgi:hypothetical protein
MQETKRLRRHLAINRLEHAVSMGRRGRFDLAIKLADEAIRLDPEVPQAHAIMAKMCFWTGDIDGATTSLMTAERAGLSIDLVQSMREAIQQLLRRGELAREVAVLAAEAKRAREAAMSRALAAVNDWFTAERLTAQFFLACILLVLGIASRQ